MNSIYEINKALIFRFLKKYTALIVLFGVFCALIGLFSYLKIQGIQYASTSSLVQNDNNYNLVQSYDQFTESDKFKKLLDKKIDQSSWKNKPYSKEYSVDFTAKSTTSPFFTISVTANNPTYARYLTEEASRVFTSNVGAYFSGANISVVMKSSEAKSLNMGGKLVKVGIVGFIIGVVLSFCFSLYRLILVGNITDADYVKDVYQLKKLGTLQMTSSNEH
ncbi:hypothetical protein C5Z25_10825 [Lactobacillus sp. CBA3605]|uniref:hypothetical protein n=1 Tax=Lactobacillus sp. CBA3605 TaxID=2099788 RepID=UPI000CFC1041|nr:hypothetical protein [Lactobacillus sp. CBA3605]AVK62235.1 hypothetical protein C5Z25_10825 [Lactobacillus sp. CBA3605]